MVPGPLFFRGTWNPVFCKGLVISVLQWSWFRVPAGPVFRIAQTKTPRISARRLERKTRLELATPTLATVKKGKIRVYRGVLMGLVRHYEESCCTNLFYQKRW